MSPRPVINQRDMESAIARAMSSSSGEQFVAEWLAREGVSQEALVAAAAFLSSTFATSGASVQVGLLTAFVAGWDVHKAFHGEAPGLGGIVL